VTLQHFAKTLVEHGSQVSQGVPIDGVQLGPMLGKGSYGRVYHGYWQGTEVAVKVRKADL
jgi:predicted Ser/Thr protein kinase